MKEWIKEPLAPQQHMNRTSQAVLMEEPPVTTPVKLSPTEAPPTSLWDRGQELGGLPRGQQSPGPPRRG